ncbi:TetR/AcrR family transcriptional regulator [Tomitella gaofuii]|uniref:TetR/AcrR family transcriptional regulator n=1 Tax=Tomitella gaofuii TaxID=2760083 RepID=UPI0015FC73C0|nr:TetR/AcrR family transcriptional regulator [Tomitella gaofuii]
MPAPVEPRLFAIPAPPTSARGLRTRAALVAAARAVFERMGFLDARLIDITTEAQCSAGTFYNYFDSKEQIFSAVLEQAKEEMMHPGTPRVPDDADPATVIEASTRAYLIAYQRNAKLMGLMEQVAGISPEFRRLRHERAEAFVARNARSIANLQARGLADPEVDADLASRTLSGMISRVAFSYFVADVELDEYPRADFDEIVRTAGRLWVNALRIPQSGAVGAVGVGGADGEDQS